MKKILMIVTTMLFSLVLGSAAMAGTIDVNVEPGVAFHLEHDFVKTDNADHTSFGISWGINDQLCLEYAYTDLDGLTPHLQEVLSLRYEILNDLAVVANVKAKKLMYVEIIDGLLTDDTTFDSSTEYGLGLRGKIDLGETAELVGELTWNRNHYKINRNFDGIDLTGEGDFNYSENAWELYTQIEFKMGEIGTINIGLDWVRMGGLTDTAKLVGAEFYCGKTTIYFDYYMVDDSQDDDLCLGIEWGI